MFRGRLRFIHASNVYVDHQLCQTGPLSDEVRETVRDATTKAFGNLVDACLDQLVDFLLLTGESFDVRDRSLYAGAQLREGFCRLAEHKVPVIVVAGRAAGPSAWKSIPELPANVAILDPTENAPVSIDRDERGIATVQVRFAAPSHDRNVSREHSRSDPSIKQHPAADAFSIGVTQFPGTQRQWEPSDENAEQQLDTDLEERLGKTLAGWDVDYLAVQGNDERFSCSFQDCFVHDPGGTQGLNPQQTGPHGATLVEISESGGIATRFLPTGTVRWERVCVELRDVAEPTEAIQRMRSALFTLRPEISEQVRIIEWIPAVETQCSSLDNDQEHRTFSGFCEGVPQNVAACGCLMPESPFAQTLHTDSGRMQFLRLLGEELKDFPDVVLLHRMPQLGEQFDTLSCATSDSLTQQFLEQLASLEAASHQVRQQSLNRARQIDTKLVEGLDELARMIAPSDILNRARTQGTSWVTETRDAA